MARKPEDKLATGRLRRTAQAGRALGAAGLQGARGNHQEAAERMVRTLGELKGGAAKIAQLASFIATDFSPDEYRGTYQAERGKLRTNAPAMSWDKVRRVLEEEWDGGPGSI